MEFLFVPPFALLYVLQPPLCLFVGWYLFFGVLVVFSKWNGAFLYLPFEGSDSVIQSLCFLSFIFRCLSYFYFGGYYCVGLWGASFRVRTQDLGLFYFLFCSSFVLYYLLLSSCIEEGFVQKSLCGVWTVFLEKILSRGRDLIQGIEIERRFH